MFADGEDESGSPFGLSLVAFYGPKPGQLVEYLFRCQELLCAEVSAGFVPYEIDQIHATIVGLEGRYIDGRPANENFLQVGQIRPMNLPGAIELLQETSKIPFQCRLGGFDRRVDYGFRSLGKHPFERSFDIQPSGAVVAIGWPFVSSKVSNVLFELRRSFLRFNILHKYHMSSPVKDNDCYFVLGTLDSNAAGSDDYASASEAIRTRIATSTPASVTMDRESLSFVRYSDRRLPTASTLRIPLAQGATLLDPATPLIETPS